MKTTYKIRSRKEPSGSTFYQLTIPREWIEQTHATEIQFKKGENNQLIIVPVTFSGDIADDISIERPVGRRFQLKPEQSIDERIEDLFFGDEKEEEDQTEGDVENLDLINTVNKKYRM